MIIVIYFVIIVLFAVLLLWTWNNTKEFDDSFQRIAFIIIGLIILSIISLILFNISKTGINYPNKEMIKEVRKMILLLFIPINGFLSLPHIASLKSEIMSGTNEDEKIKRKIIILSIIIIVATIIEVTYLKQLQNGIIDILNSI